MAAGRTARERARADITQEIKDEARAQLREHGPHGLSLRSVARALGFASSALYRYFPSRDELLTALIIDAYNSLADAATAADDPGLPRLTRWCRVGHAVRAWARANPAEYMLIYGSPVPGYKAPQDTVAPASRMPKLLATIAEDVPDNVLPPLLREQMATAADLLASAIAPGVFTRVVAAWAQLLGLISFELFGQFTGAIEPADELFETVLRRQAVDIGLAA